MTPVAAITYAAATWESKTMTGSATVNGCSGSACSQTVCSQNIFSECQIQLQCLHVFPMPELFYCKATMAAAMLALNCFMTNSFQPVLIAAAVPASKVFPVPELTH